MNNVIELLPCPFCGQQDAFAEQLDSDASVVICQGRIDEHSACLARGPVSVQESEDEDQPGKVGAIREWNRRAAQPATEHLWAVHAQGPDELWAAESHEAAEQHAAALNALPGQTDTIKVNAIVIRSPWSEVEHWKTLAEQWRHEAEDRIASVLGMTKRLEKLEADHSLLASESMAKTLDIVAIGEALGIPGEEQQGGIAEFLEAIEQLQKDAERYRWLRDHEATCIWEEDDTEVRNHPGSLDEAVDESIAAKEASHA